jgi:hypothetical protein
MVYTGRIDDIDGLVASCQFSPEAYVLVEQFPEHIVSGTKERQNLLLFIHLKELESDQNRDIHLDTYTSGRVFDQHAELRWERTTQTEQQEGKFQVVFVGPEHEQLHFHKMEKEQSEKFGEPRDTHYFLFGVRLDTDDINAIGSRAQEGDFAQLRIPRLLRYPSMPDGHRARRLQLEVSEYVDEDTGKVHLFRYRDLQAGE